MLASHLSSKSLVKPLSHELLLRIAFWVVPIPGNCILFPGTQFLDLLGCGEVIHLVKL